MATITTISKSGPGPAPAVPTTAQFKSHVYSKYRELLGSYNGKANDILQTYPAYRVREDKGFALGGETYGGPPQSTIGNSARRIQAQLPAEPPACVQNAMMRRDKQPFTYTPGGIDLSQIKSPRMAKRISRNANSEGVTGQPKVSPLAQNNGSSHNGNGTSNGGQSSVSPAATLGAAAMGMPFQVFPTGPPAPPPPPPPTGRVLPPNGGNRSVPPPPPPPGPGPAPPMAGSSEARKSPRPQSFEPPPMGMRPEIKIPPNPMASLRKAPRPQPKNDFWIEEYRRERQQDEPQIPRPVPPSYSYTSRDLDDEVAKNTFNRTDELTVRGDPLAQQKRSPSPSNLTKPHEMNGSRGTSSIKTPPVYGQSPVPANLPPPITPTKVSTPSVPPAPTTKESPPPVRPKPSPSPVSTHQFTNNNTTQSVGNAAGKEQTVGVKTATPPPPPPPPSSSAQKDSQSSASSGVSPSVSSATSTGHPSSAPQSPSRALGSTQRPAAQALGSLYIPPIHEVFANSKQSLLTQASPPWMSSRHNSLKEQPEWVHKDEQDSAACSKEEGASSANTQPQSNERQSPQSQLPEQYHKAQTSVSQRAPSAGRDSVPAATKSVDSIVTAPAPVAVSARPSPSVPSQPLTQHSNIRPAAADVSVPVQPQSATPTAVQQQYAQQVQQAARSVGPPVGGVSQTTVTMPVNRGYPQQAPVYAQAQPVYSTQSPAGTQKERIIPIQIEKSPVQAPVTAPNFAPPPYYSPSAQYGPAGANSSMQQSPIPVGFATPHSGFTTPTAMFTNPNHFVNQGYNNISYPPTPTGQPHPLYQHHQHYAPPQTAPVHHHPMHSQPQQQQQQPPQQQQQQHRMQQQQPNVTNVRIVPIKVEGTEHTVRGPLSNTPAIIQSGDRSYVIHDIPLEAKLRFLKNRLSDPRSSNNAQAWNGNSAPNQSRSFRVLQQITDTLDEAEAEMNAKEQPNSQPGVADQTDGTKQQTFGRGASGANAAQQQDMAEGQLRRLQLSNEDKALMNRVKNQVDGEVYLHNEEDPRYRGAAIPSKAFRYLQNMTDSGQAANQSNNGSGNRAQQMFNRGNYNDSDGDTQQQSQQQYVPPSEQKVEEPKKYTGGSIPSRSFKMLQAMTDAPADPNSSDSEGPPVKLPHGSGTDIRYSPYPYPPQPYYCCPNPNWHYYDPTTNPPYYPPHHPPPPHAPGYYYSPMPPPPPPPPGHFDRGGGFYGGYMSPHHFYYAQEPCSPCTPPPYYQLSQPQTAYCEAIPSEAIHTYVITTPPPRIVVTPTPDDSCSDSELQAIKEQLGELRNVPGEFAGVEPADYGGPIPLTRSQSSLKRLSERLTNFNNGCTSPDGPKSAVRCSPCSPLNERYRTYEESTSSVPSSQSEASDSEDEGPSKPRAVSRTQGQSNGYGNGTESTRLNGSRATLAKEKTPEKKNNDEEEDEDEEDDEEEEEEEEEGEVESEDEETVGYGAGNGEPPVDEHLPHQLSVIFEEESMYGQSTVASRRTSVCSNSSTLSDCSSTLANDLDDEKDGQPSGNRTDDDIDRLDETDMEKSLVSVRLPLKLSFSKSPNNEDIATLVVGESEITGSKEKLTGCNRSAQTPDEDSGDESDTEEEDEESENDSEESSGEETDTDGENKVSPPKTEENNVSETVSNEADTDVTVTITIPSLSSKVKPNERDGLSRPEAVKHETPAKAPFKIDYEEASEVSVSVSLPLKPKGSSSGDIAKQSDREATSDEKLQNEENAGGEEEEEVDFWSQIGDEDDYQRPVRSYSRDMWSSREFSVDRQSVWSQDAEEDEEASTTGTTDFWSAENGPTEASDLWNFGKRTSPLPVNSDKSEPVQEESKDSLEFWQKENERLVKDLYERRASEIGYQGMLSSGFVKDENNNKACVPQDNTGGVKTELQNERKTEDHSEEEAEDGSDSESDNDSEEYETSNTSKEDSEAEQDVGDALPKQLDTQNPTKQPKDEQMQVVNGIADMKGATISQDDGNAVDKVERDKKLSVKERISLFETQAVTVPSLEVTSNGRGTVTPTMGSRLRPLSRQRQLCEESEAEDDSGVTSDMSKHISEVETDSECFPEMRKMTRYQRAATHSRLFKLLQDESNNGDSEDEEASEDNSKEQEHNRSNTKQHDGATREETTAHPKVASSPAVNGASRKTPDEPGSNVGSVAETRRDRLTLPISHQSSSGNDSLSSSTSSASPVSGTLQNEKLAEELVQSLLMKKKGRLFRNLPLEKLHAAALKILQEDLESNGTISSTEDNMATVDSTPALTPQEFKSEYPTSYSDYYDTWCSDSVVQPNGCYSDTGSDCGMVKMFRTVPEHQLALAKKDSRVNAGNGHWSPRCPRVFSNKNIPRLMGVRETDVVEPSSRGASRPPSRASSNRSPFTVITPAAGLYNAGSPMDDCPNRTNTANRQFKLQ